MSPIGIPERACVVKRRFGRVFALLTVGEWSWDALNPEPVSEAPGRMGCQCWSGWAPGLLDTTGLAPGPVVGGRRTGFGCLGIPSPRTTTGWWAWSSTATAGLDSITFIDPHHQVGSADPVASSQPGRVRTSRHLHHVVVFGVEAADLMVTQPVEDQGEEFAGCCHLGDVVASSVGDAVEAVPDRGAAVIAGHCWACLMDCVSGWVTT